MALNAAVEGIVKRINSSSELVSVTHENFIKVAGRVVQRNGATAEESAAASEELNAQAEQLQFYVKKLMNLATGRGNHPPSPPQADSMVPGGKNLLPEK